METASDQLQQFVHRQQGEKLRSVIHQIDTLSQLLLKLYTADFLGIFYHNSTHQLMLPVSYQHWEGAGPAGLDQLEGQWLKNIDELTSLEKAEFDSRSDTRFWEQDGFAKANSFQHHLQYPIYDDGRLRGVVLAYWQQKQKINDQPTQLMKPLMQLLLKAIEILEQTHLMDSVIIRMSSVLRLVNTNLARDEWDDVVGRVVEAATHLVPKAGVVFIAPDKQSKQVCIQREAGPQAITDEVRRAIIEAVQERHAGGPAVPPGELYPLALADHLELGRALALDFCPRTNHRCTLVLFARQAKTLSDAELDLLRLFPTYADAALTNSLTVKELTKSNALIRESTDRLADIESLAALADMTSGIAHRLNNVIGGITGRLQLMQVKAEDPKQIEKLAQLEAMANEGARTVRRIQEFATATRATDHEPISLRDTMSAYEERADQPWRAVAGSKQVTVDFQLPDRSAILDACRNDLATIVDLLLQNAVEFAPEGSVVTVSLEVTSHAYTLAVIDRGPGIPDSVQKKVFYPFFSTKPDRDAGMGLAMVHALAVKHGATVSFESEPGEATAFYVHFELEGAREDTDKIVAKHQPHREELRILVVDDDPQLRDVLNDMLSLDGHAVTSCDDAYSALEEIEANEFDILITDLGMPGMPGMSGLDLAGEVHDKQPELPIAMITGWGTQLNDEEVTLRGIRRVLAKPFHLRDIKGLINDLRAS